MKETAMRHMSKNAVHPEHWPVLSDKTQHFIDSDKYASELFGMMRDCAWRAIDWYELAEKDREVTRWVPQDGGGDCYLIYPADEAANEYHGIYDALMLYAKTTGHEDAWNELSNLREAFTWLDMEEVA